MRSSNGAGAGGAAFRLELAQGARALEAAIGPERLAQWRALAAAAPHVAAFQGPGFVLTWYEVYAPEYEPLLLLGVGIDGGLVGVLPLAIPRRGPRRLVFAGAEHCEYAGWLADAAIEEEFPARCVALLHEGGHFATPWDWKWLAPGSRLGWLDHPALRARGVLGRVVASVTPVLDLEDPQRPRFFASAKKNFKRKMNVLRSLGEVRLVSLDAAATAGPVFERFMKLYDVRQLARYGSAPFTTDGLKGIFHRRLVERAPESARCFALMAGEHPIAFHFDIVDRRRAIHCMAPFDVAWLAASPGKLIMDLVAERLAAEGFRCFDHSPGGDPYKEEAASARETVHRLELFPSRLRAALHDGKAWLREPAKRAWLAVGLTRADVDRLRRLGARGGARAVRGVLGAAVRGLTGRAWSRRTMVVYRFEREAWRVRYPRGAADPSFGPPFRPPFRPTFRKDVLEDFLAYTGSIPGLSPQRMMEMATRRLQNGQHCYTIVEAGVLVSFGWLHPEIRLMHLTEVDYPLSVPPATAVLYGAFTEPGARGRGLHRWSFQHRLEEAFAMGAAAVYTAAETTNGASRRNAEAVGFQPVARITRIRRLGRTRWVVDPGLPAAQDGGPA